MLCAPPPGPRVVSWGAIVVPVGVLVTLASVSLASVPLVVLGGAWVVAAGGLVVCLLPVSLSEVAGWLKILGVLALAEVGLALCGGGVARNSIINNIQIFFSKLLRLRQQSTVHTSSFSLFWNTLRKI